MRQLFLGAAVCAMASAAHAEAIEGAKPGADILAEATADDWRAVDAENLVIIELERGKVAVALSPALASAHVDHFKALIREGFYDGLSFYRVIDGFVAQGGDLFETRKTEEAGKALVSAFDEPIGDDYKIADHPDADGYAPAVGWIASLPVGVDREGGRVWGLHCAGAIAYGRNDGRDTEATEFYVALQPQRYLDRNLTVFGRVIDGMEHLQALRRVQPAETPEGDLGETIVRMRVAADMDEAERPVFEILDSDRPVFAAYSEARRNRPEGFFYHRPDYLDICQFPVPVRRKAAE